MFFFADIRTADQNVALPTANKHTAQHRLISSAQVALGIVKSLDARNHGPLASHLVTCVLPYASVADGVSREWNGAARCQASEYGRLIVGSNPRRCREASTGMCCLGKSQQQELMDSWVRRMNLRTTPVLLVLML